MSLFFSPGSLPVRTILAFRYLFFRKDSLKQLKMLCGLFPVYALGTLAALSYPPGRKPRYQVNNCFADRQVVCSCSIFCHSLFIICFASVSALYVLALWLGRTPAYCRQCPLFRLYHLGLGRNGLPGPQQTPMAFQAASRLVYDYEV